MPQFNHAKVASMSTEREHHTRHGLHLNKKGKHWVASNLVTEIKILYLPPIALQWKDIKENAKQLTNPVTSIRMCDDAEPLSPGDVRYSGWNIGVGGAQDAESKNHRTLTSEQTQTVPLKQTCRISLNWKEVPTATPTEEATLESSRENDNVELKTVVRTSSRTKKIPSTRNEDFLWSTHTSKTI